jgi:hypothetical protein
MKQPILITCDWFSIETYGVLGVFLKDQPVCKGVFKKVYEVELRIDYINVTGDTSTIIYSLTGDFKHLKKNLEKIRDIKKTIDEQIKSFNKEEQS